MSRAQILRRLHQSLFERETAFHRNDQQVKKVGQSQVYLLLPFRDPTLHVPFRDAHSDVDRHGNGRQDGENIRIDGEQQDQTYDGKQDQGDGLGAVKIDTLASPRNPAEIRFRRVAPRSSSEAGIALPISISLPSVSAATPREGSPAGGRLGSTVAPDAGRPSRSHMR